MKKSLILLLMFMVAGSIHAQSTSQTGNLVKAGIADGNKLVDAYASPLNKAVIFSLGQIHYTGFAQEDEKKFSIGLQTVYLMSPQADRTFNVDGLQLETMEAEDAANPDAATIFGDSLLQTTIVSKKEDLLGRPLVKMDLPGGSGYPGFPVPAINMTYRSQTWNMNFGFIPLVPIPTSDLHIFMLRATFSYNLASKLGFIDEKKSSWDVGAGFAYFHANSQLDVKPDGVVTLISPTGSHNGPYDNQRLLVDYQSFSAGTHYAYFLGDHWKIFAGINAIFGLSGIQLKGTYPVFLTDPMGGVSITAKDIDDPLDVRSSYTSVFGQAGIRGDWKRWALSLQGNFSGYSGVSFNLSYKLW